MPAPSRSTTAPATGRDAVGRGVERSTTWRSSAMRLAPFAIVLLLAVVHAATHMNLAVDTWRALAVGREVAARGVSTTDPFSFNSRPPASLAAGAGSAARLAAWLHPTGWINQNWLAERVLAAVYGAGGLDALLIWKLANYLLVALVLVLTARLRDADPAAGMLLAGAALVANRHLFEVRAQDMTNLFVAALMLILTLAAIRNWRWIWTAVPLLALWANVHGGFVWGLMALAVFLGAAVVRQALARRRSLPPPEGLRGSALAALAALGACVVASPYRLTNLTHPLVIALGGEGREWRDVFEWLPLGNGPASELVVFIVFVAVAAGAGFAVFRLPGKSATARLAVSPQPGGGDRAFDLGATGILALTSVMAVASRRFLPLAYITGAPLLAQWLTETASWVARRRALARGRRSSAAESGRWRRWALPAAWVVALVATAAYAVPFARTYFGPWPEDFTRTSIGDRNMQSLRQPWGACAFVNTNALKGRMWSFWEEAGFWELCQQPDPASGRIAMTQFIDARAQQAFDIDAFRAYHLIANGGPAGAAAVREERELVPGELELIAAWLAPRLREAGITLAHVPPHGLETPFGQAIFTLPGWQVVYVDAHHTLVADTASEQGRALATAVDTGKAHFPNEVSASLTRAYRLLRAGTPEANRRALALARAAYRLEPSACAVSYVAASGRSGPLLDEALYYSHEVVLDVLDHRETYKAAHGYFQRVTAAIEAAQFLIEQAKVKGDRTRLRWATDQLATLMDEQESSTRHADW